MSSGTCSRCGRVGEVEYGSDGQAYCSACVFYGMNKQCFRCRMYLPATELQMYKGQMMCPYCIMDVRDADRRTEERVERSEKPRVEAVAYVEQCERCGRDLEGRVYVWNGRKLCKPCLEEMKETWTLESGKPSGPAQVIRVDLPEKEKRRSALERAIGDFLALAGLRKKPITEIVVYHQNMKSEIRAAKPMSEKAISPQKKGQPLAIEGLMTKPVQEYSGPANDKTKPEPSIVPAGKTEGPAGRGQKEGEKAKIAAVVPLVPLGKGATKKEILKTKKGGGRGKGTKGGGDGSGEGDDSAGGIIESAFAGGAYPQKQAKKRTAKKKN